MKGQRFIIAAVAAAVTAISGCGGGGSSATTTTGNTNSSGELLSSLTTGFSIPTEISAVPSSSTPAAYLKGSLTANLRALSRAVALSGLPADSDYNKVAVHKFIEERSLEQFEIIEQVMSAIAQTNYADTANVNAGPYKAMIAWEDEQNGVEMKRLEPWVVESRMIVINGQDVNRLLAWIEEPDEQNGGTRIIKAEFKIYTSATQNSDGSYGDYGEWDLNVKFNASGSDFFAASARIVNGVTVLKIHESQVRQDGGMSTPQTFTTKAVMHRAGAAGYGQVEYTDMNCDMNGCTPATKNVKYAYNGSYVGLQEGADPVVYKDRNNQTEFSLRYGLFYANDDVANGIAAGDNLTRHKSFGFPVRYTDANGVTQHAYYGAWQGRHSLWANGGSVPSTISGQPTILTREDHGANTAAETYTVSDPFNGTLTRRDLKPASVSDIQNVAFETFVNKFMNMTWDGTNWKGCTGFLDWGTNPATCRDMNGNVLPTSVFNDYAALVVQANDRKHVDINRWDQTLNGGAGGSVDYVYLNSSNSTGVTGYSTVGFYTAMRNQQTGQLSPTNPAVLYTPVTNDMINVNIGGSIYIQYTGNFSTGTGWVQKKLLDFDQQTWTPVFDPAGDTDFNPEVGREYYIHNNGANFVVKRVASANNAADYEVMIELQSAANPSTVATILPPNTAYLANQWNQDVHYTLVTTPGTNFMMLVYATEDDASPGTQLGTVLSAGQWGLQAYNVNDQPLDGAGAAVTIDQYGIPTGSTDPVQFNWEYSDPSKGNSWGSQQFLIAGNNYKLLSDPVMLNPITLTNGAGASKTMSLQFDGWMHGLPDLHQELAKNGWKMGPEISNKIVNIPEGTVVTGSDSTEYYVKPLEVSVFIGEVTATDITNAGGLVPDPSVVDPAELDSLPVFVEHNMGDMPADTVVKYSEGNPVE